MEKETIETPVEEVKATPEVVETTTEETVGDVLSDKSEREQVPLATFLDIKKENKELAKQMKELQKSIEAGANKKEVSLDLQTLSDKHGVDAEFLQEFADTVRAQAQAEVETRLAPMKEADLAKQREDKFNVAYTKALGVLPEFDGVVNKEVIRTLAQNPANSNKTFINIIEEAYGHLVTGKRSLDQSSSRTSKNDNQDVDFSKADRDPEYFTEVMENPTLKRKYNEGLAGRLTSYL